MKSLEILPVALRATPPANQVLDLTFYEPGVEHPIIGRFIRANHYVAALYALEIAEKEITLLQTQLEAAEQRLR